MTDVRESVDGSPCPPASDPVESQIEVLEVRRVVAGTTTRTDDELVREGALRLRINDDEPICVTATPTDLETWAHGYLYSEGRISCADDVVSLEINGADLTLRLRQSLETPLGPQPVDSRTSIPLSRCMDLLSQAADRGSLFTRTGGTHFAALASERGILFSTEDISRTCALEKVLGELLLSSHDGPADLLLLSSRVPTRLLRKAARAGIPIIAAVSAATADAVHLADALQICLCGFVRGERATVYTHAWRVGLS
jgi:FdhD protein